MATSRRFYAIADVTHEYSGYQSMSWNVLDRTRRESMITFESITKGNKEIEYHDSLITSDQTKLLAFINSHMDSWAQDPNMYGLSMSLIQTLQSDVSIHDASYDKAAWQRVLRKYQALIEKYH